MVQEVLRVLVTVTLNVQEELLPFIAVAIAVTIVTPLLKITLLRVCTAPVALVVAPLSVYAIEAMPQLLVAVASHDVPLCK